MLCTLIHTVFTSYCIYIVLYIHYTILCIRDATCTMLCTHIMLYAHYAIHRGGSGKGAYAQTLNSINSNPQCPTPRRENGNASPETRRSEASLKPSISSPKLPSNSESQTRNSIRKEIRKDKKHKNDRRCWGRDWLRQRGTSAPSRPSCLLRVRALPPLTSTLPSCWFVLSSLSLSFTLSLTLPSPPTLFLSISLSLARARFLSVCMRSKCRCCYVCVCMRMRMYACVIYVDDMVSVHVYASVFVCLRMSKKY